jgi:hypothetical protein
MTPNRPPLPGYETLAQREPTHTPPTATSAGPAAAPDSEPPAPPGTAPVAPASPAPSADLAANGRIRVFSVKHQPLSAWYAAANGAGFLMGNLLSQSQPKQCASATPRTTRI